MTEREKDKAAEATEKDDEGMKTVQKALQEELNTERQHKVKENREAEQKKGIKIPMLRTK